MLNNKLEITIPQTNKEAYALATKIAESAVPVGENFNVKTWRKRIARKINKSTRTASDEELRTINQASTFATAEFKKLGFHSFPKNVGLIKEEYRRTTGALDLARGAAYQEFRGIYLREEVIESTPKLAFGVAVHELTHLSAPISLGQNNYISMGLLMHGVGGSRFSLLEEFVAVALQVRALKSIGFQEVTEDKLLNIAPDSNSSSMLQLAAIYGEIYQTPKYQSQCIRHKITLEDADWCNPLRIQKQFTKCGMRAIFPYQINLPSLILKSHDEENRSGYGVAFQSFVDLTFEIGKRYSSNYKCRANFEDLLIKYHQTRDVKSALKYISGAVGTSVNKPLAFLCPRIDFKDSELIRDNLLFRMYVDAGKITNTAKRDSLRRGLSLLSAKRDQIKLEYIPSRKLVT